MIRLSPWIAAALGVAVVLFCLSALAGEDAPKTPLSDGAVVKEVPKMSGTGKNLLRPDKWSAYERGFRREGNLFVCDNGSDALAKRGAAQSIVLNQTQPEPIVASAWSKAEGVTGSADHDYSVYIDMVYTDGTSLWGQVAPVQDRHPRLAAKPGDHLSREAGEVALLLPHVPQSRGQGEFPRSRAAGRVGIRRHQAV